MVQVTSAFRIGVWRTRLAKIMVSSSPRRAHTKLQHTKPYVHLGHLTEEQCTMSLRAQAKQQAVEQLHLGRPQHEVARRRRAQLRVRLAARRAQRTPLEGTGQAHHAGGVAQDTARGEGFCVLRRRVDELVRHGASLRPRSHAERDVSVDKLATSTVDGERGVARGRAAECVNRLAMTGKRKEK